MFCNVESLIAKCILTCVFAVETKKPFSLNVLFYKKGYTFANCYDVVVMKMHIFNGPKKNIHEEMNGLLKT